MLNFIEWIIWTILVVLLMGVSFEFGRVTGHFEERKRLTGRYIRTKNTACSLNSNEEEKEN